MAVAPHPDTGVNPRAAFDRLYEISALVRASWPNAREISAGMSSDLEAGVAAGATQVRIGGAILGERPPVPVASEKENFTGAVGPRPRVRENDITEVGDGWRNAQDGCVPRVGGGRLLR